MGWVGQTYEHTVGEYTQNWQGLYNYVEFGVFGVHSRLHWPKAACAVGNMGIEAFAITVIIHHILILAELNPFYPYRNHMVIKVPKAQTLGSQLHASYAISANKRHYWWPNLLITSSSLRVCCMPVAESPSDLLKGWRDNDGKRWRTEREEWHRGGVVD